MQDQKPKVTSWDYIRDNYQPRDWLAVVIKREPDGRLIQRICRAEKIAAPRFQAWLRFENAHGGNVYVSMNSLKWKARGRTKQDINQVRHLYLDIDTNGSEALAGILEDARVPKPSYVLNTSIGKYQVVWKVDGFAPDQAEQLQRAMARTYGADKAATDVTRVLRIPGFINRKYEPGFLVTAEKLSDAISRPPEFQVGMEPDRQSPTTSMPAGVRHCPGSLSESERDWAETLRRLERDESPSAVQAWLEQKRQDKPNPAYYAALTVRKAVAELERRRDRSHAFGIC